MSSASNLKGRHYTALASRLRQLGQNLGETEVQLEAMADQLQSMQKLGVQCGSQFMAVSRLLDAELDLVRQKEEARTAGETQSAS